MTLTPPEPPGRQTFADVGEIVLLFNAIDFQLTRMVILLFDLKMGVTAESVVAMIDPKRKSEILSRFVAMVRHKELKQHVDNYVKGYKKIAFARNTVAHCTPEFDGNDWMFSSDQLSKMLRRITLPEGLDEDPVVSEVLGSKELPAVIEAGNKVLGLGQGVIENLQRFEQCRAARSP